MAHPYGHAARVPEGPIAVDAVLPGEGPCDLEIGFGRGHFLLERAAAEPQRRLLGLEVRLKWVVLTAQKIEAAGLGNARVYASDARRVLERLQGEALFETVFLHFPDPWWKRKHLDRRVLVGDTVEHLRRLIGPAGRLFVQTDVPERAEQYRALLEEASGFRRDEPEGGLPDNPFGIRSHRERKCLEVGLPVFRMMYRREG